MKRYICLLLAMLCLLAGCQEEEQLAVDPSVTESLVMEVPKLNRGVLEYEKLKVEPWYCGRMEFTGKLGVLPCRYRFRKRLLGRNGNRLLSL